MIKESKQPNHVLGFKERCPKFIQCPICYGCRSYSTHDIDCEKCAVNKKRDVCNKELHRDDLIEKLISKDVIKMKEPVTFMSAGKEE